MVETQKIRCSCGARLRIDSRRSGRCPRCGEVHDPLTRDLARTSKNCPVCGIDPGPEVVICSPCGVEIATGWPIEVLVPARRTPTPAPRPTPPGSDGWESVKFWSTFLPTCVLLQTVIGLATFFVFGPLGIVATLVMTLFLILGAIEQAYGSRRKAFIRYR